EEKQLVLDDRPADCSAELILVVLEVGRRKIISRIQIRIAQELKRRTVQRVGSRSRYGGHDRSRGTAKFGLVGVGLFLKLLDRIHGWVEGEPSEEGIRRVNPVQIKKVAAIGPAVDGR